MTKSIEDSHKAGEEQLPTERLKKLASIGKVGLWMGFWLILIDLVINILFPFPQDASQSPSSLERYFEHGRSIESKLNRMIKTEATKSGSLLQAGWIDPKSWQERPRSPEGDDDLLIAVYGMSFANQASRVIAEIDGKITLRLIPGPAAPPNHSFAAYMADTEGRKADVAIFGILASSVKRMRSLSGMNWTYENPAPYTYPYYTINQKGELVAVDPAITTGDDFMEAFKRRDERWQLLKSQMRQYDYPFDAFVFHENLTDSSAMIRLIRRGWANRIRSNSEIDLYDPQTGFNPDAMEIQALKVMLTEFVAIAKASEQIPVILLFNDQGYHAHLYEALAAHLENLDALMLSTHTIASSNDPRNFIGDGHFTPEANHKIGKALQEMIRAEVGNP